MARDVPEEAGSEEESRAVLGAGEDVMIEE